MQSAKRGYLEHKLLHSELTAVLSRPSTQPVSRLKSSAASSSSSSRDGGGTGMGRRVLVAAEAQHCLRLHPEATLLGVTTDHLRRSAGSALTGVNVCVCVCVCCRYAAYMYTYMYVLHNDSTEPDSIHINTVYCLSWYHGVVPVDFLPHAGLQALYTVSHSIYCLC